MYARDFSSSELEKCDLGQEAKASDSLCMKLAWNAFPVESLPECRPCLEWKGEKDIVGMPRLPRLDRSKLPVRSTLWPLAVGYMRLTKLEPK